MEVGVFYEHSVCYNFSGHYFVRQRILMYAILFVHVLYIFYRAKQYMRGGHKVLSLDMFAYIFGQNNFTGFSSTLVSVL